MAKHNPKVVRNVSLVILTLINKMHRLSMRVGSSARTILASLERTLKSIVKYFANPILVADHRLKLCKKKYIKAKALGKEETHQAVRDNIKCMTSHVFTSVLHYCVPVLSAGFLIASVRYTASLEYGIDSTYTQEELVNATQTQLDELQSANEVNKEVVVFPKFAFKSIEDSEETLGGIIDNVREEKQSTTDYSHEEMSEGYGVFLEDEFLGAVLDKTIVEDTLNGMLGEYLAMDNVTEAHFTQKVTYTQGLYLTEYMVDPSIILETLTGNIKEDVYYTVEEGDNLTLIAKYADLTLEELLALNPQVTNPDLCYVGDEILVQRAEPFLSVEYTEHIVTKETVPYETVTQNDDTLPIRETKVVTQGEVGEQTQTTEVTYIDTQEVSSTVDIQLTKAPTTEVLAVGTGEIFSEPQDVTTMLTSNITMKSYTAPTQVTFDYYHAPRGTPTIDPQEYLNAS